MNFNAIVKDITALDEYTVQFALIKSPMRRFWRRWACHLLEFFRPAAIEQYKADLTNNPVGTGPFKFVSWIKGDSITLEKMQNTGPASKAVTDYF